MDSDMADRMNDSVQNVHYATLYRHVQHEAARNWELYEKQCLATMKIIDDRDAYRALSFAIIAAALIFKDQFVYVASFYLAYSLIGMYRDYWKNRKQAVQTD